MRIVELMSSQFKIILFSKFRRYFRSLTMRVLNVAEKNDVAKNIADIVSNGRYNRRDGLSKYNKIYEFEANVLNQRCSMVMTSVSGHLLNYEFIGSYKSWQACDPQYLFSAPMEKVCLPNSESIKKTLEKEVSMCTVLIIWTDCDREGENIGYEIINVCKNVKSNLRIYRARFSELTSTAIFRAIQNLIQPNEKVSKAVDVRQELDLRIGAAFTRFQTLRLQKVFPGSLNNKLISYGSCQFPTLGFVVERYKQIKSFVPEPFWKVLVHYKNGEDIVDFSWKRHRLFDHTSCLVLHHICLEAPTATVVNVQSKPKSKWRPLPLDTVEFEKTASRKLHMNAKHALSVAEKLYTQGIISYPRTETNIFPQGMDLNSLVQMQINDPQWGEFAIRVINDGPDPRRGTKTDNAHPPIHPTKYTDQLQSDDKRVYEFVVRHFLACCSKDAEGHETTVEIDIAQERFTTNGLIVLARNYLDVYPYESWSTKIIPHFEINQTFQPLSINMVNGETSSPPLLTEADLIALMDKHGIGTDATHAEHIETIKMREYVGLTEQKFFVPGELGFGLVDGYDSMGFAMSKPHLRAELEEDLQKICDGFKDAQVVLCEQIAKYHHVFQEAVKQAVKLDEALSRYYGVGHQVNDEAHLSEISPDITNCPNCNSQLVLKNKKNSPGFYVTCLAYPKCTSSIWLPDCVEDAQVGNQCTNCITPTKMIKFCFKRGSLFPFYPNEYEGCLGGCDHQLLQLLDLRSFRSVTCSNNTNINFNNSERVNARSTNPQPRNNEHTTIRSLSMTNENINCMCGEKVIELTVKKDGPNKGRQFYKCAKPAGSGCTTFVWKDEIVPDRIMQSNNTALIGTAENITCNCALPAKKTAVQKDGPNKGRLFYTCSKYAADKCRFFQWADESNTDVNHSRRNNNCRRTVNEPTRNNLRKCSNCGNQGHNRKTCPLNR